MESSNEQHLYNVVTVTFDKLNALKTALKIRYFAYQTSK